MARHLRAAACVLIGSIRSPAELPWRWRLMRPLTLLGPRALGVAARVGANLRFVGLSRAVVRQLERLGRPEAAFVRWAMCAVLRWQPGHAVRRVRIFQIHGEADRVLPVRNRRADVIVPGGSHALSLFNPSAVNEYLTRVVEWSRVNGRRV
jgi:pimeloyl-ACP methyl ester carboxylesterase